MQELFLLVIQDKKIQRLMDELDLPPDRANLCPGVGEEVGRWIADDIYPFQ